LETAAAAVVLQPLKRMETRKGPKKAFFAASSRPSAASRPEPPMKTTVVECPWVRG